MLRQAKTSREKVALALSDLSVAHELRLQMESALDDDAQIFDRVALKYAGRARDVLFTHLPLLRGLRSPPATTGVHRCSSEAGARCAY